MINDSKPPVNEGQILELQIESLGQKGDGIARYKGFILVVPGTQRGDYVKAEVTKVLPKLGFVKVIEKLDRPPQQQKSFRKEARGPKKPEKDEFDEVVEKYDESMDSEDF
jgi:predicted RNA-binding protein with TRAM domain